MYKSGSVVGFVRVQIRRFFVFLVYLFLSYYSLRLVLKTLTQFLTVLFFYSKLVVCYPHQWYLLQWSLGYMERATESDSARRRGTWRKRESGKRGRAIERGGEGAGGSERARSSQTGKISSNLLVNKDSRPLLFLLIFCRVLLITWMMFNFLIGF